MFNNCLNNLELMYKNVQRKSTKRSKKDAKSDEISTKSDDFETKSDEISTKSEDLEVKSDVRNYTKLCFCSKIYRKIVQKLNNVQFFFKKLYSITKIGV